MRLSDFHDDKAFDVVADLMIPIGNIAADKELDELRKQFAEEKKPVVHLASAMMKRHKEDVVAMLAILNEKPVEEYHYTAATIFRDAISMLSDPELLELFGLQRQTRAPSGSASENTEGQEA